VQLCDYKRYRSQFRVSKMNLETLKPQSASELIKSSYLK
jgi:hypothetical protein